MAVISAAISAIIVAATIPTIATVATAVVAVSVAVGTVGAVVGGIGAAIGNKDLMFAGKIMGYVGLAGGLLGGALGGVGALTSGGSFLSGVQNTYASYATHLSDAWTNGVGSLFAGGEKVAAGAQAAPGGVPASTPVAAQAPTAAPSSAQVSSAAPGQISTAAGNAPVGASAPTGLGAPGTQAVSAPVIPRVPTTVLSEMSTPSAWLPAGATQGAQGASGGGLANWLSTIPDWSKPALLTTAAQGISGLASGYFTGQSAEEKLEYERLVNEQNERQRQLLNRQGSYAPLVEFSRDPQQGVA